MKSSHRATFWIFLAIAAGFGYYAMAAIYCLWPFAGLSLEQRGQLGDTFGALTSLFSALGFGGVLLTLWHQREVHEDSRQRLELQGFETILFQLLASHNAMIGEMDIQAEQGGHVLARGRDCFHRYYVRHLKPAYKRLRNTSPTSDQMALALAAWEAVWLRHRHNLGHYLRFIYNIFRYIDDAQIPEVAKRKYSRIVRSQLSDYELLILFYNCLHQNGVERFKPLAEKYALFNNLPRELLLATSHVGFYSQSAFSQPGTGDA